MRTCCEQIPLFLYGGTSGDNDNNTVVLEKLDLQLNMRSEP